MMNAAPVNGRLDAAQVENHPLVDDVNQSQNEQLSPVERTCKHIADATGAPIALFLAILVQIVWVAIGSATHWDPFPFVFLLTASNIIQLILIFVIAVAQRQQSQHDELRAESDHDNISRLLYHQQVQEQLLLKLAEKQGIDLAEARAAIATLSSPASA
ncbi:MAG: DUF1003 domain-containing protein [Candidatus Eremiobacteraeota bacterium]|nr:DUF1003 domain-containing protein [Candidatus Eremiobacteraeota bacterium]